MNYQKNTQFTSSTGYIQIPSFSKLRLGPVSKVSPLTRLLTHGRVDLCVGKVNSWIPSTVKGEMWTLGHLLNAHCLQWPCSIEVTSLSISNSCPVDYKPCRDHISVLHTIHMDFSLKILLNMVSDGAVLQGTYANLINGCALPTSFLTLSWCSLEPAALNHIQRDQLVLMQGRRQ